MIDSAPLHISYCLTIQDLFLRTFMAFLHCFVDYDATLVRAP